MKLMERAWEFSKSTKIVLYSTVLEVLAATFLWVFSGLKLLQEDTVHKKHT